MANELIKQAINNAPEVQPLEVLVRKSVNEIGKALPNGMNPERVVRIALTCISQNPELAKCTPQSFIGSLLVLAQMGLEPQCGRAYLLPFNNKRKEIVNGKEEWKTRKECQSVIGYKGLADLFYRHEASLSIDFQVVKEMDSFEYQYGTSPFLNHVPKQGERGNVIGYYAVARLRGGASLFRYMTKEECMEHGIAHSKTFDKKTNQFYDNSPWKTEPDAMCLKTVLIQLSKLLPLSVEMQRAISVDETSRDYREGVQDAMTLPTTTQWEIEDQEKAALPGGPSSEVNPYYKPNAQVAPVPGGLI